MNENYKQKQAENWRKFAKDSVVNKKEMQKNSDLKKPLNPFDKLNKKSVVKKQKSNYKYSEIISPMFGTKDNKSIKNDFVSAKIPRDNDQIYYRSVDDYINKKVKSEKIKEKYPEWSNIHNQNKNYQANNQKDKNVFKKTVNHGNEDLSKIDNEPVSPLKEKQNKLFD